jgi:hypothetical protein
LQKNYTTARAVLDAAQAQYQQRVGICPKSEFEMLRDELVRLSDELEHARAALGAHIGEHCCMVQSSTVGPD